MATQVGLGGAIGAAIGACFLPVLGTGAIPIMASLATAGAGIGWDAANAERVKDVADRTMEIADARTKECVQILADTIGKVASKLLKTSVRIIDTSSRVAISGSMTACYIWLNYYANQAAHPTCIQAPFTLPCATTSTINFLTAISTCITIPALVAKTYQILHLVPNRNWGVKLQPQLQIEPLKID